MSAFRAWLARLGGLFDKRKLDRELEAEMASHIEMHVEDNLRAGMTPEEARRQALQEVRRRECSQKCRHRHRSPGLNCPVCNDQRGNSRRCLRQ